MAATVRGTTPVTNGNRIPDPLPATHVPSVSWRLNAERLVLLGWSRAILLQLAHPLVAAGVYEHSGFRATPWAAVSRLHATVRSMLALTFGTDAERQRALHAIRTIHRRVHGELPMTVGPFPAGTRYSAEDPSLVLWVHVTLLDSMPLVYDLFRTPLTDHERDAYCAETAWAASALGAPPADVPRTWADVKAEISRTRASGNLTVGPQARELAHALLAPPIGRIVPPAAWLNRLVTVGLLPGDVREQYGFRWTPGDQRRLDRVVPILRATRRMLPERLALWAEARS